MSTTLQTVRSPDTHDISAWLLLTGDTNEWLDCLLNWPGLRNNHRMYVLPTGPGNRTPWALLVPCEAHHQPLAPHAIPYRSIGPLYLPADQTLFPRVSETEIAGLVSAPLAIWHRAIGMLPVEHDEVIGLQDLVDLRLQSRANWLQAVPPENESLPLLAITADPAGPQDALSSLADGIGDAKPKDMPGSEKESKLGRMLRDRAERGLSQVAKGSSGESRGMKGWMQNRLGNVREKLETRRRDELQRLIAMLEKDPDEGLKYAIPFGGGAPRGAATPGSELGEHDTDFDLNNLAGGDPGDAWTVPLDMQHRLLQTYRELANRELRIGRVRRAAYILAELAHDYSQAASVLETGKQYREAAGLYRDHLERPLEAARCLIAGGYLSEAIPIHESVGNHGVAGDLYTQLGQMAQATAAYKEAIQREIGQGNIVTAASIYETKLQNVEEALELLQQAWPTTRQALPALREHIALLGRLGRHAETMEIIQSVVVHASGHMRDSETANVLADIASAYPDRAVREVAADQARLLLSRYLVGSDLSTVRLAVQTLRRLSPDDNLLQRDATRFFEHWRDEAAGEFTLEEVVRTVAHYTLATEARWMSVQLAPTGFLAAGFSQGNPVVCRCSWDGQEELLEFARVRSHRSRILLAIDSHSQAPTLMHFPDCTTEEKSFDRNSARAADKVVVGPDWLPANVLGVAYDRNQTQWTLTTGPFGYAIAQYQGKAVKGVFDISLKAILTRPAYGEPFIVVQNCAIVGMGRKLVLFRPGVGTDSIAFNSTIRELRRGTHNEVVMVICRRGFSVIRLRAPGESPAVLLESDQTVLSGAISEHHYAVATTKTLEVYYRRRTKPAHSIPLPQENAIAVLPVTRHEIGVFFANGTIMRFQLPD